MKNTTKNTKPEQDNVQIQIDIVSQSIKMYGEYLDSLDSIDLDDPVRGDIIQKLVREEKILNSLKIKHPEYFI